MHMLTLHEFRHNYFHGAEDTKVGMEISSKNVELEYGGLDQRSRSS